MNSNYTISALLSKLIFMCVALLVFLGGERYLITFGSNIGLTDWQILGLMIVVLTSVWQILGLLKVGLNSNDRSRDS